MIHCELHDSFAVVTMSGKDETNALGASEARQLEKVFSELKLNEATRTVVLTGAGDHAFSIGVDYAEMAPLTSEKAGELAREWQALTSLIGNPGKPVIAAVNGLAFGAGCDLALACTWRIAASNAEFAYREVPRLSAPDFGCAARLSQLIGKSRALEMILTGDAIDAEEALRIGLINHIARDREELMGVCGKLAVSIGRNAPLAVKYALEAVNYGMEVSLDEGLALESAYFGLCFATEDTREGTRAFLEKRPPVFEGK